MEIQVSSLPATILRTASVKSDDDSYNYELVLTDFINESEAFMKITDNTKVHHIPQNDQFGKEWDCYCGKTPFLDFKLLCSQRMQQAIGDTSIRFVEHSNKFSVIRPSLDKQAYYGYWLHILLKDKRCTDYLKLESIKKEGLNETELDIYSILKIMRTNKDCLFLSADYLWSEHDIPYEVFVECAIWYFSLWISELFKYRDVKTKGNDTYLAVFIPQYKRLLVLKWNSENERFDLFDSVSFNNNPHLDKHLLLDSGDRFVLCVKNAFV